MGHCPFLVFSGCSLWELISGRFQLQSTYDMSPQQQSLVSRGHHDDRVTWLILQIGISTS